MGECYEGSRFLPPVDDPFLVVFQVGCRLEVALDMPRRRLVSPLHLSPIRGDVAGRGLDCQEGCPRASEAEVEMNGTEPMTVEVFEVNILHVTTASGVAGEIKSGRRKSSRALRDEVVHSRALP